MFWGSVRPKHAGKRAQTAQEKSFLGESYNDFVKYGNSVWSTQFEATKTDCKKVDPLQLANLIIDKTVERFVELQSNIPTDERSGSARQRSEFAGVFTAQGLITHIANAHAPAIADSIGQDRDMFTFSMVDAVAKHLHSKNEGVDPDYFSGGITYVESFLHDLTSA